MLHEKYEYMMHQLYSSCNLDELSNPREPQTRIFHYEEAMKQYQETRYYLYEWYKQEKFPFFRGRYALDKFITKWMNIHPEDNETCLRNELMLSDEAIKIIDRKSPTLFHQEKVDIMNYMFLPQVKAFTITSEEIRIDYKNHPEWFIPC